MCSHTSELGPTCSAGATVVETGRGDVGVAYPAIMNSPVNITCPHGYTGTITIECLPENEIQVLGASGGAAVCKSIEDVISSPSSSEAPLSAPSPSPASSSSHIPGIEVCTITDGSAMNKALCECGSVLCVSPDTTGMYCHESMNRCRMFPSCNILNGSAANLLRVDAAVRTAPVGTTDYTVSPTKADVQEAALSVRCQFRKRLGGRGGICWDRKANVMSRHCRRDVEASQRF